MWIPIDTRLADHPKVHQIAGSCRMPHDLVTGLLIRLWGLCADLDTDRLPGDLASLSQFYRLPDGFLAAMVEVGWAEVLTGEVRISTRGKSRREIAKRAADARWDASRMHARMHDASECIPNDASGMHMPERERERKRKRQTQTGGAPPPTDLDGSAAKPMPTPEERAAYIATMRATLNGAAHA